MIEAEYLASLRRRLRAELVLTLVQLEQLCPGWWADVTELAEQLGTDRASLNRSLTKLERLGLVRRESISNTGGNWLWWVKRFHGDRPRAGDEPAWLLRDLVVDRAVEQAIDSLTKHTHENRFGVEGWVTNSGYMLNRRFIRSYMAELSWSGRGVNLKTYGSQAEEITDLIKALCFLTGRAYAEVAQPSKPADGTFWPGEWYEWGFFRFRAYKKGTVHFEFLDEEVWAAVNARYARIKGQVLPEQYRRPKRAKRRQGVA